MIHRIGIHAPVEPGTMAYLRELAARELPKGDDLDIYIVNPPILEPITVLSAVSKFPEYVTIKEYKEQPFFDQPTPLGSLQRNHRKYKRRGKY